VHMSIVIERTDGHMCTQSHKGKRGWKKGLTTWRKCDETMSDD